MRHADQAFGAKLEAIRAGGELPPARDLLNLARRLDAENKHLREELTEVQRLEAENKLLREELSEARRLTERLLDTIQAVSRQAVAHADREEHR
jgi:regulator of replication initiation timing